jgi:hypothetical protein
MNKEIDGKALQIFPYMVFIMVVSILFGMLSPVIRLLTSGNVTDFNLYFMNASLFMMCYFLIYISILWIFSCLYSLMDISRAFSMSCTMTACYILSELVAYVLKWLDGVLHSPRYLQSLLYIVRASPTFFIMLMFAYFMEGAAEQYKEMGRKKKYDFFKKLLVLWNIAFVTQMILNLTVNLFSYANADISILLGIFACAIYLYNMVVMIIMYINVKGFCFDFYLYSYNNRVR